MKISATHTTRYLYGEPVMLCHTEVHLAPRSDPRQQLLSHTMEVSPEPSFQTSRRDYFGNEITVFSIHQPHRTLTITSRSEVELDAEQPLYTSLTPPWEQSREEARAQVDIEAFRALEFTFRSPHVNLGEEFQKYAASSFSEGRPIGDASLELCRRIFEEFKYDPRATTVSTPVEEVLRNRRGVCQDFAHLMIACLRSLGLPARYVSGYLRSGEKTLGAEASHAWCSVFAPGFGWLDFDPTNNVMPHGNHVTVAYGRDYSDVAPVKGVALGGGEQIVDVSVEVLPPAQ